MTTINLRDFYYWYSQDKFIEVSDEVFAELLADKRYHKSHEQRMRRNKSQYSLDVGDGIETAAIYREPTPPELVERMEQFWLLCCALNSLPEIQGRRVEARYILGMKVREIAEAEGVSASSASQTIRNGIKAMRNYLQKFG